MRDRVRSLAQPTGTCTSAAASSPARPNAPNSVFLAPWGATSSTSTGITTASIASMNPASPKLYALT